MENLGALVTDLAKAQGEMKNAAFDMVNPHFKNRYASLAAVRDAVVPILSKHGIAVVQTTRIDPFVLVTTLMHKDGSLESVYPLAVDKPQAMGSQITYARRYCLLAICGIAGDEDDDAENAKKSPPKPGAAVRGAVAPPEQPVDASAVAETDQPVWQGPLKKTELQNSLKALCAAVQEAETESQLDDIVDSEYAEIITQAKMDKLDWWEDATPQGGPSIKGRIEAKRNDLRFDDGERQAIIGESVGQN